MTTKDRQINASGQRQFLKRDLRDPMVLLPDPLPLPALADDVRRFERWEERPCPLADVPSAIDDRDCGTPDGAPSDAPSLPGQA